MKNIVLCLLLLLISTSLFSQDLNERIIDPDISEEILYGHGNREGLLEPPFDLWFDDEYSNYVPVEEVIDSLKQVESVYKIMIVMATWCEDSRREVPRFFNILDAIEYDDSGIEMIMVNRQKLAEGTEIESLNIEFVPTFIFYNANKEEIGRIVERPEEILETDFLRIVKRENK